MLNILSTCKSLGIVEIVISNERKSESEARMSLMRDLMIPVINVTFVFNVGRQNSKLISYLVMQYICFKSIERIYVQ